MNYARQPPDFFLPIVPDEHVMSYHKTYFLRIYRQLPCDAVSQQSIDNNMWRLCLKIN
jgi:hypothetical protein